MFAVLNGNKIHTTQKKNIYTLRFHMSGGKEGKEEVREGWYLCRHMVTRGSSGFPEGTTGV